MSKSNLLKTLGPGIIFASMAIGVSHLVQSTRAGAMYGFGLVGIILLTTLLKYPFFEFSTRYANATGKSLIDGYFSMGRWVLFGYFILTLASMFFVMAAVGVVTAGFFDNLFGLHKIMDNSLLWVTIGLFVFGLVLLTVGQYRTLDSLIKVISGVLLVSTILAFVFALIHGPQAVNVDFLPEIAWSDATTVTFLIALMGWMPTAIDLSSWTSLWTVERMKQTGYHPSLKESLFDFNFGYAITAVLAVAFVTLGAFLLYGTNVEVSGSSAVFANQVVKMYTSTIGAWSYWIVALSAFSIMFGTSISVMDGYARVIERTTELLFLNKEGAKKALKDQKFYNASILVLLIGAFGVIYYMLFWKKNPAGFRGLVDLATTISFLIAPLVAIVNFKLVTSRHFPEGARPKLWLRILSWLGLVFLTGFSLYYLGLKTGWI